MLKIILRSIPFLAIVSLLSALAWAEAKGPFSLAPLNQERLTSDEGILFSADMLLSFCMLLWALYLWIFPIRVWVFWRKIFRFFSVKKEPTQSNGAKSPPLTLGNKIKWLNLDTSFSKKQRLR